jgi:hypothetical protein
MGNVQVHDPPGASFARDSNGGGIMDPDKLIVTLLCIGTLAALGFLRIPLSGRVALLLTAVPPAGLACAIAFC